MQDILLTASEASTRLLVSRNAISMWKSHGWIDSSGQRRHLTVAGHNLRGAAQFRWGELLIAERDTRRQKRRSHRKTGFALCSQPG